jgi:hypothetical protein
MLGVAFHARSSIALWELAEVLLSRIVVREFLSGCADMVVGARSGLLAWLLRVGDTAELKLNVIRCASLGNQLTYLVFDCELSLYYYYLFFD